MGDYKISEKIFVEKEDIRKVFKNFCTDTGIDADKAILYAQKQGWFFWEQFWIKVKKGEIRL